MTDSLIHYVIYWHPILPYHESLNVEYYVSLDIAASCKSEAQRIAIEYVKTVAPSLKPNMRNVQPFRSSPIEHCPLWQHITEPGLLHSHIEPLALWRRGPIDPNMTPQSIRFSVDSR